MNRNLSCFTIPAGEAFLQTLAGWVLEAYGGTPDTLAKVRILLPNRRAVRSLRDTFLDITGGRPMLLPRMLAVGDVGEEDLPMEWLAEMPPGLLAPAIAPTRRLLLLSQLVQQFESRRLVAKKGAAYPADQSMQLARQLARFVDEAQREGVDMKDLATLVPHELAAHWQQTLDFLTIVSSYWPRTLQEEGAIDPVDHRNRLLAYLTKAWRDTPPPYPVIAAGSTGTQPATAALLSVISRMKQGRVILPGLDKDMPDTQWEQVGATHPQYALKQLLKHVGCERKDVEELQAVKTSARMALLAAAFQPPEATAHWQQLKLPCADALRDVRVLEADTQADEARMIAVALRETLETPGKTAALITPDRGLARMVAMQMRRFGLSIDDSAGTPLAATPAGSFLRLVIDAVASQAAPAPVLAMLRHPLAAAGKHTAECRRLSRVLETALLRGVRHAQGMEALVNDAARRKDKQPALFAFVCELEEYMRPLAQLYAKRKPVAAGELMQRHLKFAQWLASTPEETGEERLWSGDDGRQLSDVLAAWMEQSELLPVMPPLSYPAWFDVLLAEEVYRPRYAPHPRLAIMSPIEARLQRYDRVILGGLNEGAWPALPSADPWMSRPMRSAFGLPPAEREIGQGAHDIYMLAGASPEVLLTRARKVEGVPKVPSRWLVRLHTLLFALDPDCHARVFDAAYFACAIAALDAPVVMPSLTAPAPVPPLAARPRSVRVTAVDTWLRDPYMIYAQYVLGLKALNPLDKEPDAADFGSLVHRSLEQFLRAYPKELPENPREALLEKGREAFVDFLERPAVAALWWPRFEAMADWLIEREREHRKRSPQIAPEVKGEWIFDIDGKNFTLVTRIDRMEVYGDGGAFIIDYKTGQPPSKADIEKGLANQLLLEALIALHGKLTPALANPARIEGLQYWKLGGSAEDCEISEISGDLMLESCRARLEALIRRFDNPDEPFAAETNPALLTRYNDYDHLTRRDEWGAA